MSKKSLLSIFMVVLMLVLAACGGGSSSSSSSGNDSGGSGGKDEKFTIKLAHQQSTEYHYQKMAEKFKELVEKNSDGRIEVQIFPNSQLGNEMQTVEGLQANTVQIAVTGGVLPTIEPKFAIVDMPFLFEDAKASREALDGELGQKLFDLLPQYGLYGLAWTENGFRNLTNSVKPIKTLEDLKGLKIRVPENEIYIDTFEALGAFPTPVPFNELFTALEQGVVDGQENPTGIIYTAKFFEVQDHMTVSRHFYGSAPMIMSLEFYESLPEDLKKVVDDAAQEAMYYQWEVIDEEEANYIKGLKEAGMEVVEEINTEEFKKLTEPIYDKYEEIVGKELMDLVR